MIRLTVLALCRSARRRRGGGDAAALAAAGARALVGGGSCLAAAPRHAHAWPTPHARTFASSSAGRRRPDRAPTAQGSDSPTARAQAALALATNIRTALARDAASAPPRRRPLGFYATAFTAAADVLKATALAGPAPSAGARARLVRRARAAACALAAAAAGGFDAAGHVHAPSTLTLATCAFATAGLPDAAADLVRQAAADAAGEGTGLPGRPLGAGAAPPTRPPPPPPAATAAAASALARTGRAADAASLIQAAQAAGGTLDEAGWAAVVRFGGRAPGGVGARPARDLLAAASAAGVAPGQRCHSALIRAELDAGSLPNALAAADAAVEAGVRPHPCAWAALAARAAAHFGQPGADAVIARADAADAGEPAPPDWVDLAAAAAGLPPGRVPGRVGTAGQARRVRAIGFVSSGDED